MLIFWLWFYKDYGSKEAFGLRPQYLIKKVKQKLYVRFTISN